jgi:hypothetical protein
MSAYSDISRLEPAVLGELLSSCGGILPVTSENSGTAKLNLALPFCSRDMIDLFAELDDTLHTRHAIGIIKTA